MRRMTRAFFLVLSSLRAAAPVGLAAADVSLVSLPLLTGGTFFEEAMTGTGDSGAVPGGDLSN